jgi:hypothetical protein
MWVRNAPNQSVGFVGIKQDDGTDYSGPLPLCWRQGDTAPYALADGTVYMVRAGHFVLYLAQTDTDFRQVSFKLEAPGMVSQEVTISPFEGVLPGGGITVEDWPVVTSYPATSHLAFETSSGFNLVPQAANTVEVELLDAGLTQRGLVGTSSQSWHGPKTLHDLLTLQSGVVNGPPLAGIPVDHMLDSGGELFSRYLNSGIGTLDLTDALAQLRVRLNWIATFAGNAALELLAHDSFGSPYDACYGVVSAGGSHHVGQWGVFGGLDFSGGLMTGGSLSVPWADLSGTPTTLGGYGIPTPLDLAEGGSAADLHLAGPGVWTQAALGGPVSVVAPGTAGNVLTSVGGVWASAPGGGGGGMAIGGAITGAVGYGVLFEDPTGHLAQDSSFFYQTGGNLHLPGSGTSAVFNQSGQAAEFHSTPSWSAYICTSNAAGYFTDGSNAVGLGFNSHAVDVASGPVRVLGTAGNSYRWLNSAAAPTPQVVGAVPLSGYGSGAITQFLGTPDAWALVKVAGLDYKLPLYL